MYIILFFFFLFIYRHSHTQVQDMKNMSRRQWNLQLKINQAQNKQTKTQQISYIEVVLSQGKHYRRKFNEKKNKKQKKQKQKPKTKTKSKNKIKNKNKTTNLLIIYSTQKSRGLWRHGNFYRAANNRWGNSRYIQI